MKKFFRVLVGVIVVLVGLVLVVVLTLPLTINPLVKSAASTLGPKVLGVPVAVGKVALNPFAGRLIISQLSVGNPKGYSERAMFAVDKVDVDLKMTSLLGDVIEVEKIQVDAPAISYETRDGAANFDALQANAQKSADESKAPPAAEAKSAEQQPTEKKPGKKVIIELFALNDAKVAYSSGLTLGKSVTLPLPSITLRDIGKESGGASFMEATTKIVNAIVGGLGQAATAAAGQAGDLLKGAAGTASDAAQGAADTAAGAAKSAGAALKNSGVTNALQGMSKGMSGAARGVTNAAAEAAKNLKKMFK